jgi:triosephosphate isomerase (TIM)
VLIVGRRVIADRASRFAAHCEIVICPSFLDVENAVTATRGTNMQIGAQDLYWENEGAFTAEVSDQGLRLYAGDRGTQ